MKNLNVALRKSIDFKSNAVAYCVDHDNGILFVLFEDLRISKTQIYSESVSVESEDSVFIASIIDDRNIKQDEVLLFEFVVEVRGILIALKQGYLILVSASNLKTGECIYKHDRRLSSTSLTPSQDIIALADEDNNIQVMSSFDCDILHSSNALAENNSLFKPVGVGWGSKETQFFGLDGRPSQEKQVDEIKLSDQELATSDTVEASESFTEFSKNRERSTLIDWRGDGHLIATLTYIPTSNKHDLKVWNRNLELQYMSEQLVTVERGLLCWVPDGKFVCCAQRRDRRVNEIALFEKNGLVRQRISLPTFVPDLYISSMAWSPNSKILAIIAREFIVQNDQVQYKQILMLFTMQNWHYYLKFSTNLTENCDYMLKWDSSNVARLHLVSTSGQYSMYDCNFQVTYSPDRSLVAVIDSSKILITPLDSCIIPPPMSAITIDLKRLIYRVACSAQSAAQLLILTLDDKLIVLGPNYKDLSLSGDDDSEINVIANYGLSGEDIDDLVQGYKNHTIFKLENSRLFNNLTPLSSGSLCVASKTIDCGSDIVLLGFNKEDLKLSQTTVRKFSDRQIISIMLSSTEQNLIILLDDSSFYIHDLCNIENSVELDFQAAISESKFSYNFIELRLCPLKYASVISLGQDSCLRYMETVIASNSCTSFVCTGSYLIYTTTDNHMHFILLEDLVASKNELESWSQPIEPGATIVLAVEHLSKVILQMPRGNLETLHPRVLVLKKIIELLKSEEDFVQACKIARRHRVNMNFLIDYLLRSYKGPGDLNAFALSIARHDPNLLCLVLTELDNHDTIVDRYSDIIRHITDGRHIGKSRLKLDKVNYICKNIRLPNETKFLNPRLQCLLKTEPKRTGEALKIVHSLSAKSQMEAIKFLLYFVDIDQLFNDSLSTYNTNITLMVASASNKDPKQYLAFLDDLNEIGDENLRRYKIDMFVKNYELAFEHLLAHFIKDPCDKEKISEQLVELVTSKRIYKSALAFLNSKGKEKAQPELTEMIWFRYASYLMDKRYFNEAGLAFSKALKLKNSQKYYDLALSCIPIYEWERSIALIARSQMSDSRKSESLERIAAQLISGGQLSEAILVKTKLQDRCEMDIDMITKFIERNGWYLAEFLVSCAADEVFKKKTRVDIYESVFNAMNNQYSLWSSEFDVAKHQLDRLKILLTSPKTDTEKIRMDRGGFISDSLSTVDGSEMSSILSGSDNLKVARSGATSIKTRSSSKSQKPHQKRIKLQEGSRYEDRAIVLELKEFIAKQAIYQQEATKLSAAIYEYCPHEVAEPGTSKINKLLTECMTFSQSTVELLWPHGVHLDQTYSLYTKMGGTLSSGNESTSMIENVDLEVLMRPNLPNSTHLFEI